MEVFLLASFLMYYFRGGREWGREILLGDLLRVDQLLKELVLQAGKEFPGLLCVG